MAPGLFGLNRGLGKSILCSNSMLFSALDFLSAMLSTLTIEDFLGLGSTPAPFSRGRERGDSSVAMKNETARCTAQLERLRQTLQLIVDHPAGPVGKAEYWEIGAKDMIWLAAKALTECK